MKKLLLIAIIALSGCSDAYNGHYDANSAYMNYCVYSTVKTTLTQENETVILHSTCTKSKR